MNIVIDEFNSNTGFSAFNTAQILTENELTNFIAGKDNTKSCLFEFKSSGDYIEKTGLTIDVTDYNYIVCHFYSSFNKYKGAELRDQSDFVYTITFNDTQDPFYIPLYSTLSDITFDIQDITTITKIKIEYLGTTLDRLFCSHCLAIYDELPLDVFLSTQSLIQDELTDKIGKGFLLGTINAAANDDIIEMQQINYQNLKYIDRYAVVNIDDTINTETHVLDNNDERFMKLGKDFDGQRVVNTYSNANIYLTVPVRFGVNQKDYNVPSINITGFDPTPILRGGKIENLKSTFQNNTTSYTRQFDQIYEYRVQIACIDRMETDTMSFMSQVVRDVIAREILWINGRKFDIYFDGKPEYIALTDNKDPIVGLIYTMVFELKEELWRNQKLQKTQTRGLTVTIQ